MRREIDGKSDVLAVGILILTCLAPLVPGASGTHGIDGTPPPGLGTWENQLRLYSTGEGKITAGQPSSGSDSYSLDASATSGAEATIAGLQGRPPAVDVLLMERPLARTYFLNLSKPVVGNFFFSNAPSQAIPSLPYGSHPTETGTLRLELLANGSRVAGTEVAFHAEQLGGEAWTPLPFIVRPETNSLELGSTLSLRISRWGGLADLTLGTGGDHQSFIELRYFDSDPLGGVLYLEKGRLISSATGRPLVQDVGLAQLEADFVAARGNVLPTGLSFVPTEVAGEPTGSTSAVHVWAFILVPLVRRPRQRAVAGALVLVALGGCIGKTDHSGATATTGTGVTTRYEENETLRQLQTGGIRGTLHDDNIVPQGVAGADVIVLSTNLVTQTSPNGGFEFPNVSVGEHTLRFQKPGFHEKEFPVTVNIGHFTVLRITLELIRDPDRQVHTHPTWGDLDSKLVYDETFTPDAGAGFSGTPVQLGPAQNYDESWYCTPSKSYPAAHYCFFDVPLQPGFSVWPGTGMIDVNVTWEASRNAPPELGLSIITPTNLSSLPYAQYPDGAYGRTNLDPYVPRPQGDAFHIAMFPSEADVGHALSSAWRFTLHTPLFEMLAPEAEALWSIDTVHVRITLHKSVVPYEPVHPRMWWGRSEILVLPEAPESCGNGNIQTYPDPSCRWDTYDLSQRYNETRGYFEPQLLLVPPGTAYLRGTFSWTKSSPLAPDVAWRLAYQGANIPWEAPAPYAHASLSPSGTSYSVEIAVKPEECDQFYQIDSLWRFFPDDDAPGPLIVPSGYYSFTLNLTAVREPTYPPL